LLAIHKALVLPEVSGRTSSLCATPRHPSFGWRYTRALVPSPLVADKPLDSFPSFPRANVHGASGSAFAYLEAGFHAVVMGSFFGRGDIHPKDIGLGRHIFGRCQNELD
jgi:hypothetical protein